MVTANATEILEKLARLRTELVELAYSLDTRGQLAAADVAMTTSARIGELCEELAAEREETHRRGSGLRSMGTIVGDDPTWICPSASNPCR